MSDRSPILEYADSNPIPVYVAPVVVPTTETGLFTETGHAIMTETGHMIFENKVVAERLDL